MQIWTLISVVFVIMMLRDAHKDNRLLPYFFSWTSLGTVWFIVSVIGFFVVE